MNVNLLDRYIEIEQASEKMLEAAKTQDWHGVSRQEKVCAILIDNLRAQKNIASLSKADRQLKTEIMKRILTNDAKIRLLCEPWLDVLERSVVPHSAIMH